MTLINAAATGRLFMAVGRGRAMQWYNLRPTQSAPVRHFFWGKNGGDGKGGGDDGKKGPGDKRKEEKDKEKEKDAEEEEGISTDLVVSSRDNLPERMPIGENAPTPPQLLAVPIARRPVFPGFMSPLVVTDETLIQALMTVKGTTRPYVGLFLVKDPTIDLQTDKFQLKSTDQIHKVGVMAHVQQIEAGPAGAIAMVMGHRRVRITGQVGKAAPPLVVKVDHLVQPPLDEAASTDEIKATCNEILATLRDIIRVNPLFQQHIAYFARKIDVTNPYALADFAASLTTLDAKELQDVIETLDLGERLRKALIMLKKEQQLSALQQHIKSDVEKRIDKQQRTYFLQEQLKSIKKELGLEKDDKEALLNKFRERVSKLVLPGSAKGVYDEEMEKLSMLERNSSEFNVTRSYLDWLTSLPWGKFSRDNFDLTAARRILDEDHYGMSDVKDRILEFIAVGKLTGSVQGKILCLVGPPGVGKTSIGKSIARSLDRKFYRFSVGGLSDVAEIKGHRRTYIGAMPGKLIQCLKTTGVSNPLVLIDEIDKIGHGRGYSGDPSSALLEMLDPNQNGTFMDHYLDTPYDASKVLFICTANSLDTIPGPLLDRMEVIRLAGYDAPEKIQIAKRYLDPKARVEMGLQGDKGTTPKSLQLTDGAVEHLIRWYARESGVRNLEKYIGKIYRKAAVQIVAAREKILGERKQKDKAQASVEAAQSSADAAPAGQGPEPAAPAAAAPAAGAEGSQTPVGAQGSTTDAAAGPSVTGAPSSAPASSEESSKDKDGREDADAAARAKEEAEAKAAAAALAELAAIEVEDPKWTVTADNLDAYVGKPVFTSDRLYDVPPCGVTMGLAWTNMGGSALYIEVVSPYLARGHGKDKGKGKKAGKGSDIDGAVVVDIKPSSERQDKEDGGNDKDEHYGVREIEGGDPSGRLPSGGHLRLTGKLGDVMQESAQIAYTLSRRFVRLLPGHEGNDYLDTMPLHMHVPEGATPKDGPSAGVTMTTALLSVATQTPVRPDLAMTGEVDLMGTVMPVGGIREKTMAARRAGVKCLVFPWANKRDFDELPEHLKEGLEVHFARKYEEVYRVAFSYNQDVVAREQAREHDPKAHPQQ